MPELPLTYRGQQLVRLLGAAFLTLAVLLTVLGVTLWRGALTGSLFALYWSWCFLCALAAMLAAGMDLVLVRRAARQQRRQLVTDQLLNRREEP